MRSQWPLVLAPTPTCAMIDAACSSDKLTCTFADNVITCYALTCSCRILLNIRASMLACRRCRESKWLQADILTASNLTVRHAYGDHVADLNGRRLDW